MNYEGLNESIFINENSIYPDIGVYVSLFNLFDNFTARITGTGRIYGYDLCR